MILYWRWMKITCCSLQSWFSPALCTQINLKGKIILIPLLFSIQLSHYHDHTHINMIPNDPHLHLTPGSVLPLPLSALLQARERGGGAWPHHTWIVWWVLVCIGILLWGKCVEMLKLIICVYLGERQDLGLSLWMLGLKWSRGLRSSRTRKRRGEGSLGMIRVREEYVSKIRKSNKKWKRPLKQWPSTKLTKLEKCQI